MLAGSSRVEEVQEVATPAVAATTAPFKNVRLENSKLKQILLD